MASPRRFPDSRLPVQGPGRPGLGARRARLAAATGIAALLALLPPAPSLAADARGALPSQRDVLAGPVEARVIEVRDGDTLRVRARIWVGQEIVVNVRIAGIDTPELRGRCPAERRMAERARAFVVRAVGGRPIRLTRVRNGKYAGRVLAAVETEDGVDLAEALRRAGLARSYGGGRRAGWCGRS